MSELNPSAIPLASPSAAPPSLIPPALIRIPAVCELVPIQRAMIYKLIRQGKFPRPAKIGRASVWVRSEIESWITAQIESPRNSGGIQ